ncbi:uncharacterized protein A4U43_C03F20520 [Asparagus officinalis]|uniref:UDP-glucose/GDP-mannose dehydrogenase C-terminal domain-containing protein n=1 Tax=Asparagus officinalis TaxID=4686 RepID=A0A5P1FCL9_ASPOF|nr:uncharacterized protein A4U43_C03F20520 [Asparagus officinalis]
MFSFCHPLLIFIYETVAAEMVKICCIGAGYVGGPTIGGDRPEDALRSQVVGRLDIVASAPSRRLEQRTSSRCYEPGRWRGRQGKLPRRATFLQARDVESTFRRSRPNLRLVNRSPDQDRVASVIKINDYQKSRFVNRVVSSMFNTVSGKKIAVLGFAFKKDTGDTRETPAIDVCKGLLGDRAQVSIYDPQVTEEQIQRDLAMNKFDWDHPIHLQPTSPTAVKQVSVTWDAYEATKGAHGVCILTEWDEFKKLDYKRIYDNMQKPAFIFDGRNVVDVEKMREIGFIVYSIGKPLDAWLKDMPAVA